MRALKTKRFRRFYVSMRPAVFGLAVVVTAFAGGPAHAADLLGQTVVPVDPEAPSWYVVAAFEPQSPTRGTAAGGANGQSLSVDALMSQSLEIDFNYGRGNEPGVITFSDGTGILGPSTGAYTVMLSGSYDVSTGTALTPRVLAGVGVSSLDGTAGIGLPKQDLTRSDDLTPTFQFGVGADYAISDNWAFTAEYRAFYQGGSERETEPVDPQVSQRFTIGAKIRF